MWKRQVIWCYICWDLDMFELLPPSTLFLPLFTPINLNFKKCSKVPTWHQPDSQSGHHKVSYAAKKIALVLRVTLMSWFYLSKWFEPMMYKSALRWPPIIKKMSLTVTFEVTHIRWWFWRLDLCFFMSRNLMVPFVLTYDLDLSNWNF